MQFLKQNNNSLVQIVYIRCSICFGFPPKQSGPPDWVTRLNVQGSQTKHPRKRHGCSVRVVYLTSSIFFVAVNSLPIFTV